MNKFICTLGLITLSSMVFAFSANPSTPSPLNDSLSGKWITSDNKGNEILIEFSPEGKYNLWVNGESLTNNVMEYGQIMYSVVNDSKNMTINLFDENKSKAFANLSASLKGENLLLLRVLNGPDLVQPGGMIELSRVQSN